MFECRFFNERTTIKGTRRIKKDESRNADEINNSLFIQDELSKLYTTIYNLS